MTAGGLRFGYGTNGFADHRLTDALAVLADLGYDGVALTLDHQHLDPYAPGLAGRVRRTAKALERTGLAVVVETGARYLLDPMRKHRPTLLSAEPEGRAARRGLLRRAIAIGAELGAEAVHFWSGTPDPGTTWQEAWGRLEEGCAAAVADDMSAPTLAHASGAVLDALTLRTLKESLLSVLTQEQRVRLAKDSAAVAEAGAAALDSRFPAAGRYFGRGPLPGWADWSVEDAVRAVLLIRLPLHGEELAAELIARYGGGDAAERRGVLRALPFLPVGDAGLALTDDALRTNDNRLIAAALGPYARAHLDQCRWRQAVLKCLFTGIPLHRVAGLHERRDAELARMAQGFAAERRAAGRTVPADLWLVATHED